MYGKPLKGEGTQVAGEGGYVTRSVGTYRAGVHNTFATELGGGGYLT